MTFRTLPRWTLLFVAGVVAWFPCGATAQQSKLKPTDQEGRVFRHEDSKTTFTVPKDWEIAKDTPSQMADMSVLHIRRGDLGVDATITWVPVYMKKKTNDPNQVNRDPDVEGTFDEEKKSLELLYGKDKVVTKEPVAHPNGKSAQALGLNAGPRRNDKEEGYILMFDSGPDQNNRWKVMVRANMQKKNKDENVADRINAVQDLFKKNFQW
jgi:hypothetical protein